MCFRGAAPLPGEPRNLRINPVSSAHTVDYAAVPLPLRELFNFRICSRRGNGLAAPFLVEVIVLVAEVTTFLVEVEFDPYDLRHAKISNRHSTHFYGTFPKIRWWRSPYL